jgi:flavodoxin
MKITIVYDSIFGNTEKIAKAIGDALAGQHTVTVNQVNAIQPEKLAGSELVIVGSPTRGFRPTPAISAFLKGIPNDSLSGARVAAFDTRASVKDIKSPFLNFFVVLFGYAAEPIAGRLKKKGGSLSLPPEGFYVKDREGPLYEGEVERAAAWAMKIVESH